MQKPHHVLRDAPVATTWFYEAARMRIDEAKPDELEDIAREIVPFAWGAIRKVRGGAEAKRSWLTFCLSLMRCAAIRAIDSDWSDGKRFEIEEPDPVAVYRPIVEAVIASGVTVNEEIAKHLREQVGGSDWENEDRSIQIVRAVREQMPRMSDCPAPVAD